MNKNCNDVKCPTDKNCKDGWRYTNGAIWKRDFNITLKCIGTVIEETKLRAAFVYSLYSFILHSFSVISKNT